MDSFWIKLSKNAQSLNKKHKTRANTRICYWKNNKCEDLRVQNTFKSCFFCSYDQIFCRINDRIGGLDEKAEKWNSWRCKWATLTVKEALDLQVSHAEAQHRQLVQPSADLLGERQQAGQLVQLSVQTVPVAFGRVGLGAVGRGRLGPADTQRGTDAQRRFPHIRDELPGEWKITPHTLISSSHYARFSSQLLSTGSLLLPWEPGEQNELTCFPGDVYQFFSPPGGIRNTKSGTRMQGFGGITDSNVGRIKGQLSKPHRSSKSQQKP